MDALVIGIFLLSVLLGSYVQAVTGFAMGMIVIAVVAGAQLVSIPVITAVASLLSLLNILLAIRGQLHAVQRQLFVPLALGQLPAIWCGVWLLENLDANAQWLLQLLLGGFITLGSLSMMLRPKPLQRLSSSAACVSAGFAGGVLGGMFSASGPIMGWFNYRQPLAQVQIRATLLACFALTTSSRTLVVGWEGGLTEEVWRLTLVAMPVVMLGTWAGHALRLPLSDVAMKRFAFGLLLIMGTGMVVQALNSEHRFFQPAGSERPLQPGNVSVPVELENAPLAACPSCSASGRISVAGLA